VETDRLAMAFSRWNCDNVWSWISSNCDFGQKTRKVSLKTK
jgi:hypothetical protein